MSVTQIYEDGRCRTNLWYREGQGLSVERINLQTKQQAKMPITAAEIEGLIEAWPAFKDYLSTAGVPTAVLETRSPPASKASPAPASSASSSRAGSLL